MYGAEQPPVSEATVDLVLQAALEQFEFQATNRLLLTYCIRGIWRLKQGCQEDTTQNATTQNATTNSK